MMIFVNNEIATGKKKIDELQIMLGMCMFLRCTCLYIL